WMPSSPVCEPCRLGDGPKPPSCWGSWRGADDRVRRGWERQVLWRAPSGPSPHRPDARREHEQDGRGGDLYLPPGGLGAAAAPGVDGRQLGQEGVLRFEIPRELDVEE